MMDLVLRRRDMMWGKTKPTFNVVHPNFAYFNVTTTGNNAWLWIWYGTRIKTYYLDGVQMDSSYYRYSDSFGQILIPTAGTHDIWLCPNSWDNSSNVFRPSVEMNVVYLPSNGARQLHSTNNTIKTLYINKTSPPTWNSGQSAYSALKEIYVPESAVATYKNSWSSLASKIQGCVFN